MIATVVYHYSILYLDLAAAHQGNCGSFFSCHIWFVFCENVKMLCVGGFCIEGLLE